MILGRDVGGCYQIEKSDEKCLNSGFEVSQQYLLTDWIGALKKEIKDYSKGFSLGK